MCTGAGGRVKSGVTVSGVFVGGMSYSEAENAVRRHIAETLPPLTVHTPAGDYTFAYPALSFTDNASAVLRKVKKGETVEVQVTRTWANAEAEVEKICAENARPAENASLDFSAAGFSYTTERNGIFCNAARLLEESLAALEEGREEVSLVTEEYPPEITEAELRARTRLLSRFTTNYDGGNAPRAHNIALAAKRISGTTIEPGGEFSFNKTVGKRTAENGFREAAVILEGQFVPGVGGGVCQASTTLFGAALRAGLKITESRPHSLSVAYVPPSLDAMVSDYSDLKFVNPYEFPVYLLAKTGRSNVTFEVYGKPDGKIYKTESVVLFRLSPPPAQILEGKEDRTVRAGKEGVGSESYLLTYDEDGKLLSRKLIRRDTYAVVQGIYERKPQPAEEPPLPQDEGEAQEKEEIF